MKPARIGLLSLALFWAASSSTPAELPLKPGSYERELILDDGTTLRFGLFVPAEASESEQVPLIIALHYGGQVTPYYGLAYMKLLVEPAFNRFGAIIAAPDCPDRSWRSPVSEAAVLKLVGHLKKSFPIDDRRVAVTGFSLGGMGTWHMVARHPDLFSAAIVMAGEHDPKDLETITATPVYIIHSDADDVLPLDKAREAYWTLKKKGAPVTLKVVRGIGHYQTADFIPALALARSWLKKTWK